MLSRSLVLAGVAVFCSTVPANPHDASGPTVLTVPVNGGWDARAACDQSFADGAWVFTVVAATGNISKVNIQLYRGARPTKDNGEFRVCASCPDPFGREQQPCLGDACPSSVASAGSLTINKPKAGNTASLTLAAGQLCWRAVANGKGSVTVSANHP